MNIPNSLTLARIVSVPVIVWLILREEMLVAFILFGLGGISDALDGLIAKHFNLVTKLGKYLDPLADKILLVSIYVTLGVKGDLASWLVILVVSRDVLIVGGILFSMLLGTRITIQPVRISKINTFFQIVLAAMVLGSAGFDVDLGLLHGVTVYIVGVTTVMSGYSYLSQWIRQAG
ncbi:CDP-alcohol phosphatidyltransferase family protein [Sneathiella chinensis]|uniref:CDP-alcohol phosphatidyltransferase family protein n=1 Tax=Sneathiella chinensis TaxID=349750 RepID=UPI00146EEF08|nr:CDP-alcohol phosphatidyltransferase family protein [Sneathiella chinensis]